MLVTYCKPRCVVKFTSILIIRIIILFLLVCLSTICHKILVNFLEENLVDATVEGWSANASRSLSMFITPLKDTAILSNRTCCSQPLLLLIIVCSAIPNINERLAIRETWGNFSNPDFSIRFILGTTMTPGMQEIVRNEALLYNDIIQEDFMDTYNNLTLKSAMGLKQIVNFCPHVKYILKSDDDTFVHVPNLLSFINLQDKLGKENILIGKLFTGLKPDKNVTSKWYSPKYLFDGKVYPDFLSGSAYLMNRPTAVKLYYSSLILKIFYLEDVFITGMCAKVASVEPMNDDGFQLQPPNPVTTMDDILSCHRVSSSKMRKMWEYVRENLKA